MSTMKLYIGDADFWYSEQEYGPPLPHSLWLWDLYGCYEHYDCVLFADLFAPKGLAHNKSIRHVPLDRLKEQYSYGCGDNCECYIHWLLGEMAHKDYPQTFDPVVRLTKKGRAKTNG